MMGHKICFYGMIWLIIPYLCLLLLIWSTASEKEKNHIPDVRSSLIRVYAICQDIPVSVLEIFTVSLDSYVVKIFSVLHLVYTKQHIMKAVFLQLCHHDF